MSADNLITFETPIPVSEAALAVNGRVFAGNGSGYIGSVTNDSRLCREDTLFVALRGEKADGHSYIVSALQNRASCALCEREVILSENLSGDLIIVPDALEALLKLGAYRKSQLKLLTVGITGSVGKTTTKELTASVLGVRYNVCRTIGNLNSLIGMPMMLLSLRSDHTALVLEMGMSEQGEIAKMSSAAQPDYAFVTNIGSSHIEYFGSREGIRDAKLEIAGGIKDGGFLILNGDEPLLDDVKDSRINLLRVSAHGSGDILISNIHSDGERTAFNLSVCGQRLDSLIIPVLGSHNAFNAAYAAAAGVLIGLTYDEIASGLMNFKSPDMRQNIYSIHDLHIIEDCYNASPESMKAALKVLRDTAERHGGRAVAVLGEMRELGTHSERLHFEVGLAAAHAGVGMLYVFGKAALPILDGARSGGLPVSSTMYFPELDDFEALANAVYDGSRSDDTVLFKASRAVALERVISSLRLRLVK